MNHPAVFSRCFGSRGDRSSLGLGHFTGRACLLLAGLGFVTLSPADEPPPSAESWPILFEENFEAGLQRWVSPDPAAFRRVPVEDGFALDQYRQSDVRTPVRSPFNRALVLSPAVGSFQLDVRLKSTARDYPHRSLCLFFGYQNPAHLYYVHFGQVADEHANQIFVVDGAPRTRISRETTAGTPWDNEWHHARIIRDIESGSIEVYFDDLERPAMRAVDRRFLWGQVGVGSFDDTGLFDDIVLRGVTADDRR